MLSSYVSPPKLEITQGYTVTRARLRQWSAIKVNFFDDHLKVPTLYIELVYFVTQVTVFVCAYSIMYAGLFLAERLYFDPGKVIFVMCISIQSRST